MEKILILFLAAAFGVALSLILAIPGGFVLMLLLGFVHDNVLTGVIPIGFGSSYVLAFLIGCFISCISPDSSSKS